MPLRMPALRAQEQPIKLVNAMFRSDAATGAKSTDACEVLYILWLKTVQESVSLGKYFPKH